MGTSGTIEQGQQGQQGATPLCACQVKAVLEAMPSSNLKPAGEDVLIDLDERRYRQTFMYGKERERGIFITLRLPTVVKRTQS